MRDLKNLRIGYAPYDATLMRPGDRRRFVHYARLRDVKFELAQPSQTYDVLIITAGSDISVWGQYPRGKTKVVYDLIDSYLAVPKLDPKAVFRGVAKFAFRQSRKLMWSYAKGIEAMCRRADAVICSTEEQERDIHNFCDNVHRILDFQSSVVRRVKTDYAAGDPFHLAWEGLAGNVRFLKLIAPVLQRVRRHRKIVIHAVTNFEYGQYLHGKVWQRRTADLARRSYDEPVMLYAWNEATCSAILTACDLAVIPVPLDEPINTGKPENKLLLFWRMGIPTLVSATPAYQRAMERAGLPMACRTPQDWEQALETYMRDENARREAGQKGRACAQAFHSEEKLLAQWDALFESLLAGSKA